MTDKKHLILRGTTWYINYRLPKDLQPYYGNKEKFVRSLKTDSLKTAQALRDGLLLELDTQLQSLGVNPRGARYRELVKQIRTEYSQLRSNKEFEAFDSFYDIDSLIHNGDKLKAAAVLEATGNTPPDELKAPSTDYTLFEVGELYLNHIEGKKGYSTIKNTKRVLRYFKDFNYNKDISLKSITRPLVVKFIEHLRVTIAASTTTTLIGCLNGIWNYAHDRGYVETTSVFKDHRIKEERSKPKSYRPFTLQQWKQLMLELTKSANTDGKLWIAPIGLMTGMRINEICGLHKEDVYKESNGEWFIRVHDENRNLKTESSTRRVPIHSSILPAIQHLKTVSDNEFLIKEVISNPSNRAGTIGTWFSRNKVKHITTESDVAFHSLRGMLATAFENANVEEGIAATIIGHTKDTMTYGLYSNGIKPELATEAMNKAAVELTTFIEHFPKPKKSYKITNN
ncbi:DUF6538 domain-containing protein [Vibrio thalassae]|nr:DUF6538 domain-containing protein [Vibrio thalassae]